jgi:ABC-type sugar transport system permease subunit
MPVVMTVLTSDPGVWESFANIRLMIALSVFVQFIVSALLAFFIGSS